MIFVKLRSCLSFMLPFAMVLSLSVSHPARHLSKGSGLPIEFNHAEAKNSGLLLPKTAIAGVPFRLEPMLPEPKGTPFLLEITERSKVVFSQSGTLPTGVIEVTLPESGSFQVSLKTDANLWQASGTAIPGILTILPPILAILMALLFRQVVIALFAGVWLGAFLINDFHIFSSFYYVIDHYVLDALAGESGTDHVSIAVFTLLLGGMVGVFSRMGGTQGIVDKISGIATTPRRGQLATWLMGVVIFFDDYTNTLIVGNTMRPLTDRLRISREKLSYIVDSTAAPVTCIAVITSWIGFEISLIKDAFNSITIDRNPFTTFLGSIPYSFYPILTLIFGLIIAASRRDFGPMLKAERRARETGKVLSDRAVPISSIDTELSIAPDVPRRWFNAVIPITVVVVGTIVGLLITGKNAMLESGAENYSMLELFRESNSFVALLWSSITGCAVAIFLATSQRILSLTDTMNAWVAGIKSMVPAIIILVLAWCIGSVCQDLRTADYLVVKISGSLSWRLLPSLIFLTAAVISFSTGTSWGTMTILTPITIPLAVKILEINQIVGPKADPILLASIAAILAGSVFGDHCSPISDTTIMSSMASASDHVDHVRTQLPYAVTVAIAAMLFGYLPSTLGLNPALSILLGSIVIFGIIMILGRKDTAYENQHP